MTVTAASFRAQFREFTDPSCYPDSDIDFWINVATIMLDPYRWSTMLDVGVSLYVAHNVVMDERNVRAAKFGGLPGATQGMLTAKAVDKVSAGYDVQAIAMENGGDYNSTSYGIRFLKYSRMFGAGGIQLGGCGLPGEFDFNGGFFGNL